ncbi:thioredoxin domain-containing protein [Aureispira]|nr:thioredoxin domain-containing protein [Aureispira sp.]
MTRPLFHFAITSILLVLMAFKPTPTSVEFLNTDWDTSKKRALSENKLYFVDFDASYCATCRKMDESTYMDEKLANYMDKNVIALRVDVQDFDGVMWSQQYEVEALPTMLIFDAQGSLVKRLVGYQTASDLISQFKSIKVRTKTPSVSPQPIAADKPMTKPRSTSKPDVNTFPNGGFKSADLVEVIQPTGMGLYEIIVSKQPSEGYGVQVGVFSTYKNVLEEADKFNRKYNKKTLIHIDEHNGSTVYKLILGVFDHKRTASNFRNDLRRDNTDGLIKDLRVMG